MPVMHSRTTTWQTLTMCACVAWIGAVCFEGSPQTEVRLTASAKAYVSGINKLMTRRGKTRPEALKAG